MGNNKKVPDTEMIVRNLDQTIKTLIARCEETIDTCKSRINDGMPGVDMSLAYLRDMLSQLSRR